jgi:hypothetical protein
MVNAVDIKETQKEWYCLHLENGTKLKVTGNHRIWIENLRCWRRVDQLDGSEELRVIY